MLIIVPNLILIKNWWDEIVQFYRRFLGYESYDYKRILKIVKGIYSIKTKSILGKINSMWKPGYGQFLVIDEI